VVLVLAIPGPTNTLLATAAATGGVSRSLALLLAELGGYGISISTFLLVVRPIAEAVAFAALSVRGLSSAYLVYLSWKLWEGDESRAGGQVRFRQVLVTTLLNPKAMVLAFLVFPDPVTERVLVHAALFSVICSCCGFGWILLGGAAGRQFGSFVTPRLFGRGAAVALACFALVAIGSMFRQG
jgi:threonine/homoserine/homoserine lactone efflux protein